MKKSLKTAALLSALVLCITCFSACGSDAADSKNGKSSDVPGSAENEIPAEETIKMEDIAWEVGEGIVDGERYVFLSYVNNSENTIVGLEINFCEKPDITEEEKTAFVSDIAKRFNLDESDPANAEDLEELRVNTLTMRAKSEAVTLPGETADLINCYYYGGFYYVKSMDHYALVVPDMAEIKYIEDGKVYTLSYDYRSGKYTKDNKTQPAYYWTDSGLENVVPKPDAVYVANGGRDDKDTFMFDVFGWSHEDFDNYVKSCKERGFTEDPGEHDGFYSADSADGYNVYLYYDSDSQSMSATVKTVLPE